MRRLLNFTIFMVSLMGSLLINNYAFAEKYRVGTEGIYPPWNFQDKAGNLDGFEIALVNKIAEINGDEIEYVTMDFDALIPNMIAGRIDFFLSGMTINDDRKRSILFSSPYAEIPNQFVSRTIEAKDVQSYDALIEALKGKTIGAQAGTLHGVWVEETLGDQAELRNYRTAEELVADVAAGRIDAGFAEQVVWSDYLKENKDAFHTFGPTLTSVDNPKLFGEGIGIGIGKDNNDLKEKIDTALDQLRKDGTLKQLATQYFGFDASR